MRGSFLKGAVVGLVCALVGGATVALAGGGVGGVFNLGQSNSVDARTTLTGASAGIQLQVTNTNAAGRNGLGVASANGYPTGSFTNTGGGPAAAFVANAGVAPFTVNSSTKVANLTADCGSRYLIVGLSHPGTDPIEVGRFQDPGYYRDVNGLGITRFNVPGGTDIFQVGQNYRPAGGGFPRTRMVTFIISGEGDSGDGCHVQARALAQGF